MRVVELFAGVGGFRIGLEAVSEDFYKTVWANQWEPGSEKKQFAYRCYKSHFSSKDCEIVNADIDTVWEKIPEHDLLVGGFPCQDYSVANTSAKGIEGKKGTLWWAINNIISSKKRPRYLFLENVDRLIRSPSNHRGRDFSIILRCFADQGYYVEWRVINAADYGMAQKRRRIFIFASRIDQEYARTLKDCTMGEIVSTTGFFANTFEINGADQYKENNITIDKTEYPELTDLSKNFENTFYKAGVMRDYKIYTRDYSPKFNGPHETLGQKLETNVSEEYNVSKQDIPKWKAMKESKSLKRTAPDGKLYNYSEGNIPFPDKIDIAGRTLLTSEGTANRSSHIIIDPESNNLRTLTPIECERLNGFPDNWTADVMTMRQRYFCMGNALVVPIVTRMGQTLMKIERGVEDD